MPTSLLAGLATGAAASAGSSLIGGLLGGDDVKTGFSMPGFSGGGLTGTFDGSNFNVSASGARKAAVGGLSKTFNTQGDLLAGLRSQLSPGIGALTNARLSQIENARTASVGNLRDNLARRRVLGSSFGQDAISRANAEFGQAKAEAAAESFLQELESSNNLIQQEFTARRGAFQTNLDEMNLEASMAAQLTGKASDVLSKNAQTEALLTAQSQQGAGKLFGQFFQKGMDGSNGTNGTLSSLLNLGSGNGPIASPF